MIFTDHQSISRAGTPDYLLISQRIYLKILIVIHAYKNMINFQHDTIESRTETPSRFMGLYF